MQAEAEAEAEAINQSHSPPVLRAKPDETLALKERVNVLFKQPRRRWTYVEEQALCEVANRPDSGKELDEIEAWKDKMSHNERKYFPNTVLGLLEKWPGNLDRARNYVKPISAEEEKKAQQRSEFIKATFR